MAIKRLGLVEHTNEISVNQFIYKNKKEAEANGILPIIELLEDESKGHHFAVMPR